MADPGVIRLARVPDDAADDHFPAEEDGHGAREDDPDAEDPADDPDSGGLPPGEKVEPDIQREQQKNRAEDELVDKYFLIVGFQDDGVDPGRHDDGDLGDEHRNQREQNIADDPPGK